MLPEFEKCRTEFLKYGFEMSAEQYEKFNIYAEFLVEYNNNVNLTAITEPQEILVKHAGFPTVPMKIMRSDIKITLLDSLEKRIIFLEKLCDKLGIEAKFIHGRAEDVARIAEYRENFDFSCARAVANLAVLSE